MLQSRLLLAYAGPDLQFGQGAYTAAIVVAPRSTRPGRLARCLIGLQLRWRFEPEPYHARAPHLSVRWTGREPGRWRISFWRWS
jgi:hypothetical protein